MWTVQSFLFSMRRLKCCIKIKSGYCQLNNKSNLNKMKKQLLKKLPAFIPAVIAMFLYSIAGAQDIYPSAIIQIKKSDPDMMRKLPLPSFSNHENELAENFKNKTRDIQKGIFPKTNNSISTAEKNSNICPPLVQAGFEGNPLTPFYHLPVGYYASECNVAISNAGKIISISNGWLRYYNENGTLAFSDSLYHFGSGLIDVRLLYDPKKDRFVFITLYGITDFNGSIFQVIGTAIAFSKTNDPVDGWNMYFLPDTIFGDSCSGDYPLLGISDDEIFITESRFNKGGNSNHTSVIQINKNDGYAGLAAIRSQIFTVKSPGGLLYADLIPAQGGSTTYGPNMYFVMANETGGPSNVYRVYEVSNTIASGQALLKMYGPVSSNITYAPAQLVYQPGGILLNDLPDELDYIQNSFFENGVIQFSQNTNVNGKAAINIGRISGIPNNLSCTAKTISDPNLYLSYPSIAYAGNSSTDNSAILGIEHSGANTYPGLSAVYVNSNFEISQLTTVKAGADTINSLWGDYSGICRRYNHSGEIWYEGQYGSTTFPNINWIAKLRTQNCEPALTVATDAVKNEVETGHSLSANPNPFSNAVTISYTLSRPERVTLRIYDISGKLVKKLADGQMQEGPHHFQWDAKGDNGNAVTTGTYILQLNDGDKTETRKLAVVR
jgi:flagellar hook capping protein FlgD